MLDMLVGADELHRIRTWVSSPQSVELARAQFELSAQDASALLLWANQEELDERQHISLGLRWCDTCMGRWYHSVRFQDRRIRCCPWHGERLRETCPTCARAVDPLGRPWRCSYCGEALVNDPERWLSDFKTSPGHDGCWPKRMTRGGISYEEREEGVLCHPDPDGEGELPTRPSGLDYWQHAQLYESVASLWDTVLREHRQCALEEPYGYYSDYYELAFKCPAAAAGRAVFGQMDLDGARRGAWPRNRVLTNAYQALPAPETVSLEVRRAMLRELPRAWLADALLLFGEVARTGRTVARWEPHPFAFQAKTARMAGVKAELVTKRPESWLRATSLFCGECCPNGKAFTGDWDPLKLLLG
ncbi:MAG: hypothetical protein H6933_11065 [Burkholderiaceae bacterium]|nr:hypothetical protein [Burkholderiaceae bacterium]